MHPTKCRCGKNQINFKKDIGPFYVDTCCIEAGYDGAGNRKEEPKDPSAAPPVVESKAERKAREKVEKEAAEQKAKNAAEELAAAVGISEAEVAAQAAALEVPAPEVESSDEAETDANSQDA